MKKKLLCFAASACLLTFLAGCASGGTYSKHVELGEYKGLNVKMVESAITDDVIAEEIEMLLEEHTTQTEVDRAAKEGDVANINYSSTLEGNEFEGSEEFELLIGGGYYFEEFDTELIGAKAGDEKKFQVTIPESYGEELVGKKADFTVKVNGIFERNRPEYNDEFVAGISEQTTVAEYEKALREEMLSAQEADNRYEAGLTALSAAVDNATFDGYPQELYDQCKQEYDENNQRYAEMFGIDVSELELGETEMKQEIENQVNQRMTAIAIAEEEEITVSDEEYSAFLTDNAEAYGFESAEEFEEAYTKDKLMEQILLEKVQAFLVDNANVEMISEEDYYGEYEDLDSAPLDDEDLPEDEVIELEDGALPDGVELIDEGDLGGISLDDITLGDDESADESAADTEAGTSETEE